MLVSILSVSLDPCKMSWAEAALSLAPLCGDLNPEDLNPEAVPLNLSLIYFCLSVISFGA